MDDSLQISPSKLVNKRNCIRQWLLLDFLKLPRAKKGYFAFGSVLHKVAERWLLGDENGRDAKGNAVELYPKDWATNVERDGTKQTLLEDEQILIKDLIQLGIEEGTLTRTPGREVEEWFNREVCEGVNMCGCMDVQCLEDLTVEDHKTTGKMKYALSDNKLHGDLKMRCYAIELAMRYFEKHNEEPTKPVTMVLNYFLKDPLKPKVSRRKANIPVEELQGEWERIVEDAEEMKGYADKYKKYLDFKDKPDYTDLDHELIPGPEDSQPCNAYGGCPCQPICSGRESVQRYFMRVDSILNPNVTVKENTMSSIFKQRLEEMKSRKGTSSPFEKSEPEPVTVETMPPPAAPWAEPKCTSCGGSGLDKHDSACPICFKLAKASGKPLPTQCTFNEETQTWDVELDEAPPESVITPIEPEAADEIPVLGADGSMKKPQKTLASSRKPSPLADAQAKKKAKAVEEAKVEEEAQPGKPKTTKSTKSSKRGRPAMGYTLCIGTVPLRTGSREVIYATGLLDKIKKMITDDLGQPYEEQDSFKRRDMLAIGLNSMIDDFGAAWIIVPNLQYATQDMRAMVEALRVHAQTEIIPEA